MTNAFLGFANRLLTSTLTASAQVATLPAASLQNPQGSPDQGWQTPAGTTSASLLIDSDDPASTWRAFLIARTNLTGTATVRWRVGASAAAIAGGQATLDSGVLPAGVVTGIGQSLFLAATDVAGQVCQLDIADPANPDGFLNVALAYAGPVWVPSRNITSGSAEGRTDQSTTVQTRGGQQYTALNSSQRRWEIALAYLLAAEMATLKQLDQQARQGGNVLFVPFPDSPQRNGEAVFGILTPKADIGFSSPQRRSWSGSIVERL